MYSLKDSFLVTDSFVWDDTYTGSRIFVSKNTVLTIYASAQNLPNKLVTVYSLTDGTHMYDMDENELTQFIKQGKLLGSRCSTPCNDTCDNEKCCDPKNNDGRSECYWCGTPTRKIDGGFSFYDFCDKCQK